MPFTYQYDPFGTYPANQIVNEIHTVVAAIGDDEANFIVPNAAPFFMNGLTVKTGPAPTDPVLVENVDYYLTHQFVEATQSLNKRIYGSITFVNRLYTGTVYLTYQTLGGPYTLNDYNVVRQLTNSLYAVRVVTWGQIVGVPVAFPPVEHPHHTSDLTGMSDIVQVLDLIRQQILASGGNVNTLVATLTAHLTATVAHTKEQIGLSHVANYPPATQADIDNVMAGRYITPPMLVYALTKYNTSGVTINDATEITKGIARLATDAEATNFINPLDSVLMTPATVLAALNVYDISRRVPIGDYWFTGDANRDPATFLGYGTWVRVSGFPVGYDATNSNFDTPGETGGAESTTLTQAHLPATVEMNGKLYTAPNDPLTSVPGFTLVDIADTTVTVTVTNPVPNEPVPTLPPYFVICIWKRLT